MSPNLSEIRKNHFGSDPPPPPKVIISFSATRPIFENFWKKCIFPLKKSKTQKNFQKREKMSLGQADVSCTTRNVDRTVRNVCHNTLNPTPVWGGVYHPPYQKMAITP